MEGGLSACNPQAERIFGWPEVELIGQPISRLFVLPQDQGVGPSDLRPFLANGTASLLNQRVEFLARHKDRHHFDVELVLTPIEAGQEVGYAAFVQDISERKRAEKEIQQLNLDLEQRVLERTTQLEAANKELEAFSYSVSHDLRAPLRHIDGFAQMLAMNSHQALDDQGRRYVSVITESAKQMGQLIEDLLAFSKTGRQEVHQQLVDTERQVRGIIEELEPELQGREVRWLIGSLPELHADASLLRQVWSNLILNALKYSRTHLRLRLRSGPSLNRGLNTSFLCGIMEWVLT